MSESTAFELRRLKSDDVFPMFKILSKIGLKEIKANLDPASIRNMVSAFKGNNDEENTEENSEDIAYSVGLSVFLDLAQIVITNLPECKKEIYTLLSQVSGMTEKQIASLDMVTFTEMIVAFFKKEEFKDFFKVVSRLFNTEK